MTNMQIRLLEIMKWFHNLCEKENLTYYAQGGTALGAVRHNGFIPWDDDLDVGMPRGDYEKLLKISKKINGKSKFYIEFPSEKIDYVYPYAKVYDTRTTLIENTRYKTCRGIYIDVFPIDGIGDTLEESVINFKKTERMINLLCTSVCALRKDRQLYKNIAILCSRCIPKCILNSQKLIKKIEKTSKRLDYVKCKYVANLCGNWREKEIMNKEWIGSPTLCKFEDMEIYIIENSDAYLKRLYGDYMKLPPIEKRCTHHDFISIDLDKPYM